MKARAGFTLIEVTAVIVIISILLVFLVPRLMGASDLIKAKAVRSFLTSVEAVLSEYNLDEGDFPESSFPVEVDATKENMGVEMLVIRLFGKERPVPNISEDRLDNLDGDKLKESLTVFDAPDAFEIVDEWRNPIAYIHHRDYEKTFQYSCLPEGSADVETMPVKALVNPRTQTFYRAKDYQLISAGPDGAFGTEDDVTNFDRD